MKKTITIIVILAILGFIGLKLFADSKNTETYGEYNTPSKTANTSVPSSATTTKNTDASGASAGVSAGVSVNRPTQADADTNEYTMAQVSTHKDASSCWTAVRGNVYDLTSFINEHPGGAANILKLCGKDGTSAFEQKHGGRPRPEQELAGHEIGVLVQ